MDNCDRTRQLKTINSLITSNRHMKHALGLILMLGVTVVGTHQPTLTSPVAAPKAEAEITTALSLASSQIRWRPNPDRGTASGTLSGGRRGVHCLPHDAQMRTPCGQPIAARHTASLGLLNVFS